MGKKFSEFVKKMDEAAKSSGNGVNPAKKIEDFIQTVNFLYTEIDSWLQDEIGSGQIQTGCVPITIVEEELGAYSINEKWIQIGNAKIRLRPIGTVLVGTDARVDIMYRSNDIMLIRTGENVEGPGDLSSAKVNVDGGSKKKSSGKQVWKYVKDHQRLSYVTLNKDRFEDLLIKVVDGTI